jgi:uncharacterized protein involved in exopolysaccharide biosynthesis
MPDPVRSGEAKHPRSLLSLAASSAMERGKERVPRQAPGVEPRPATTDGRTAAKASRPGLFERLHEHWLSGLPARRQASEQEAPEEAVAERIVEDEGPASAEPVARPAPLRETADPGNPYWQPLIDPSRVLAGVMNSKRLIAGAAIVGALLGAYVAISTPKKFASTAEILVDPRQLQIVDQGLTGDNLSTEAALAIVENQVRLLVSGNALDKVADRLHLADDPEFNGQLGAGGIGAVISDLRALLSRRGGGNAVDVKHVLAVDNLARSLDVERIGKTFIINVTATTTDADKSALIANTVIKVFVETAADIQSGQAGRATKELTSRLDELRSGVEAAERKVEEFKADNDIVDAQGKLISDDRILKLNDQLSVARAHVAELKAKAASTRSVDVSSVLGGYLPEQVSSAAMTELRAQYAALKQQSDSLATRLGPRHPQRVAIEAQLAGARAQIEAELKRIVTSVQVDLKRAEQLQQDLAGQLAELKVQQGTLNKDMITLNELQREAAAKRSVYEAYLLRARQTGEQKDISTANISVISTAYPPLRPEGPSRSLITLAGAFLGLLFGIGIGAARGTIDSLRDTVAPDPAGRRRMRRAPAAVRRVGTEPAGREAPAAGERKTAPPSQPRPRPTDGADVSSAAPPTPVEELRESLREFREAVRQLSEERARERG